MIVDPTQDRSSQYLPMIFLPVSKKKAALLLSAYPTLVREYAATDGRRFTSVGISESQLKTASGIAEIDRSLPWRYRTKRIPVKMTPTPAMASPTLLADALSNQSYSMILGRIHGLYGGRCQVCGSDHRNRNGRRIAPRLMATWNYQPHANSSVKKGLRELIGLTAVCNDCLSMFSLGDARPCYHLAKESRKSEFHRAISHLSQHNGWPVDKVQAAITATRRQRRRWDDVIWASDISWLSKTGILPSEQTQLGLRAIHQDYTLWKGSVILDRTFRATLTAA